MPTMQFRIRIIIVLAALLLVGLTVAACSKKEDEASSPPAESRTEVKLKFYFGGEKKAATDEVWNKVSEYVQSKGLDVRFDVHYIPFTDFKEKMLIKAAAGDKWDLNFDADWQSYKQMVARGSYLPLNDLLPQYAPNLFHKYEELGTLEAATMNGEIVGLPWTLKMSERPFVGWRADLAEKAGITRAPDSIRTIEDLDKLLHELKDAFPDAKLSRTPPLSLYWTREEWVDLAFHGLGFYLDDPDMTVQAIEQQPYYLESAYMSRKWNDYKILNRDATIDNENGADQWRNGKLLFTITSHEWATADPGFVDSSFRQQMSLIYPDKRYVNRTALANVLAINRNSEHPELVLRFLDMIETDKVLYDLVQYGIEGKTYVLSGEAAEYPEGMQYITSNYMEWDSRWAFWKPQFMRPTPTYPGDFWLKEAEFADLPININSPVDGLLISDDRIKNEVARRDRLANDVGKPIEFGKTTDVEAEVDNYARLQREAGLDKIIAEVQRQVDEYLAGKE
ncbi:extracellular solute-binding protein [Cohnella lupini]|uniref:Putative aldouronate transport system substrate-binding protein n=1 Tax=Cohnella lupini TaxID=1294267 RepID=A0A3D9IT62_9BACL|nr:extracellular solute-binding protein [Cohnella lupini]RED64983.1 putative aldouronate transport system substrate-binding protein [Cohnella lupini]